MTTYKYRPGRFYLITLASTWVLWFAAAFASRRENGFVAAMVLMMLGLFVPTVTAFLFGKSCAAT